MAKKATDFDGTTNAFVQCPSGIITDGDFSLQFWVRITSFEGKNRGLFGYGRSYNTSKPGINCLVQADGDVYIRFSDGTAPAIGVVASALITLNVWIAIAVTVDRDGVLSIYKNGVFVKSLNISAQPGTLLNESDSFEIGKYGTTGTITCLGQMFDVRLYGNVIGTSAIEGFANKGIVDSSLTAWWRLNEDSGTDALDESGNSNTGTKQSGLSVYDGDVPYSFENALPLVGGGLVNGGRVA